MPMATIALEYFNLCFSPFLSINSASTPNLVDLTFFIVVLVKILILSCSKHFLANSDTSKSSEGNISF